MVDQTRMSAAEFFDLPESNQPIELIEGEVIMSPTPVPMHQDTVGNVYLLVRNLKPDGKAFIAPLDVYLDDDTVLQPDVMWVAQDSQCVVGSKRLQGAPDLVVEVLSPSTARRDRGIKFLLYEKFGVREYWLVDVDAQFVEVWRLEEAVFVRQGIYGPGEQFTSAVLGDKVVELDTIFEA